MAVKRIVLVAGLMRSGTSAVAGMLHALGVPMAVTLMAPVAPTWRLEWEDAPAALKLSEWAAGGAHQSGLMHHWFCCYLRERIRLAQEADAIRETSTPVIGFKSPLLLLMWDHVRSTDVGVPITIISTTRPEEDVRRSFDLAIPPGCRMRETWESIQDHLRRARGRVLADLCVDYEDLVADPAAWAVTLGRLMEVTDPERIAAAAAMVKEPTTCRR